MPEAPAQHEGSISASRLVKEFRANEATAEKQWRRRTITVDGTVDRIGVSFGDPYVMLSEGGSLNGVRCDMDKSRMDEAARLKKGQHIAVIGDVSNYIMGDVFLQRCRILDANPASALQPMPAENLCARTASWDAWFSAPMDFRTAHPECRPDPDTLQAPSISADRLAIEYRDNEVAAEENFKGRMLVVTGEVRSVETDMDGSPRIWLETETGRGVLCGLALSERRKAASLRKGQTVSLVGLVGVSVMRTPTMDDAVLLDGEPASYSNTARYLRLKKRDCAEVLETAQVEDGSAAEITCSRRGGGTARYLLVLRECRLGSRGDVKELKK